MTALNPYKARYEIDVAATELSAGDSDQVVTDYYNAPDATPDAEIRATREQVMEAIMADPSEFKALDAPTRDAVTTVLLSDTIVVRGSSARAVLLDAFPDGTTARANLVTLQEQLEANAERTRAERGGFLANSKAVTLDDTAGMRARL